MKERSGVLVEAGAIPEEVVVEAEIGKQVLVYAPGCPLVFFY